MGPELSAEASREVTGIRSASRSRGLIRRSAAALLVALSSAVAARVTDKQFTELNLRARLRTALPSEVSFRDGPDLMTEIPAEIPFTAWRFRLMVRLSKPKFPAFHPVERSACLPFARIA
jgi:hypothetical protein